MNAEPHFPREFEEHIDLLESIQIRDGLTLAKFRMFSLWLPLELAPRLQPLVGKTIGILFLDGFRVVCLQSSGGNKSSPALRTNDHSKPRIPYAKTPFSKQEMSYR
jgi:hypothetical protein